METRAKGAHEIVPRPPVGRVFESTRRVRYGDCDERGRLRFDALARYLQDIAGDDTSSLGIGGSYAWVVRRALIETDRPAQAWEPLSLATWCGGVGSHWAERVVTLHGTEGAAISSATIWVMIDLDAQRPSRITEEFVGAYGDAAMGRKVSSHLQLAPEVPDGVATLPWQVRRSDLDVLGHMNNAIAWSVVEEVLAEAARAGGSRRRSGLRAEIEFRAPILHDDRVEICWRREPETDAVELWARGADAGDGPDVAPTVRFVARVAHTVP